MAIEANDDVIAIVAAIAIEYFALENSPNWYYLVAKIVNASIAIIIDESLQ